MSVIGPRPALWNQDVLIAEREKYHANDVKPGLTGWAQINGRDELEIPVKAKLDGEYVEKESLLFDIKCFLEDMKKICMSENINNLRFYGRIPNSQVYQEMEECDLLLMTSEYEGLPKVIQEAAQMRLPSIYINENYNVDFITDGINGFAVSDLETMQEKIQFLLDDPTTYQKMSKAAYESIQPYTWGNVIKQYEKYFEKIYEKSQKMGVL